jgi:transcriptional regulator with PAS, ATPase and Fis domain
MGIEQPVISQAVKKKILEYNWPGNVRQLENAVIYAVNLAEEGVIDIQHLPLELNSMSALCREEDVKENSPETQPHELFSLKDSEKIVIKNALARAGNNVALASDLLGVSKTTFYRKLKEYNIPY